MVGNYKIRSKKSRGYVLVWIALISAASAFPQFFFFFFSSFQPQWLTRSSVNSALVHCSRSHKLHFLSTFSLKMGPTALFTHLKIILLQYFQFSVFSFSKISSIQTDPTYMVGKFYLFGEVVNQLVQKKKKKERKKIVLLSIKEKGLPIKKGS